MAIYWKNYSLLLFGFLCLALMGCVEISDIEKVEGQPPLGYQTLELPEPNLYSIVIPLEDGETAFRKANDISTSAVAVIRPLADSKLIDESVLGGQKYIYQIGSIGNGGLIVSRTIEVLVPKDRVFATGDQQITAEDLSAKTEYGRVFFMKGSRVRTDGANWSLRANRIISEGGVVYSFPEGQAAGIGENGRSGGSVRLSVQDVIGVLDLVLRGENGGVGKRGDEAAGRGLKGAPGAPGKGMHWNCVIKAVSPGDGGPGVLQGGKGYSGGRGGDAGEVHLSVAGAVTGGINVSFYAGQGGAGGAGGLGQRGGEAGDFNVNKNPQDCRYRKAHEGPRGPQGEQGSSGLPGLRGNVCRHVGKGKFKEALDCQHGI